MINYKYFILLLLLFVMSSSFASAALLGVNRVSLTYIDVLRGGYAEQSIVVSSGTERDIQFFYEARGEIAEWISFNPSNQPVLVNADSPKSVAIIVQPPRDTQVGEYEGKIVVTTGPLGEIQGNVGSNVEVAFEIKINVIITDTQILACTAGGIEMLDVEIGRTIPFIASVTNNGNVRIKPDFVLNIYDQFQENLISTVNYEYGEDVLPTRTERIEADLDNSLEEGQYWVEVVSSLCSQNKHFLTFSVLEKGGISDVGELIRIENKPWAFTKETVPIKVFFRNRGERVLSAQFKGVVTKDGRIFEVLESDIRDVKPDELTEFELFYEAPEFGQYKINGRVHFNNKITYEKGSILNVNDEVQKTLPADDSFLSIVLIIVLIVIGFFGFLILKKKKKKFRF